MHIFEAVLCFKLCTTIQQKTLKSKWHKISWFNCFAVVLLYRAWKRGLPRKFACFVLFHLIKKHSFNFFCVLGHYCSQGVFGTPFHYHYNGHPPLNSTTVCFPVVVLRRGSPVMLCACVLCSICGLWRFLGRACTRVPGKGAVCASLWPSTASSTLPTSDQTIRFAQGVFSLSVSAAFSLLLSLFLLCMCVCLVLSVNAAVCADVVCAVGHDVALFCADFHSICPCFVCESVGEVLNFKNPRV